jgi:uncharacterized protein (TIGR03437 family)
VLLPPGAHTVTLSVVDDNDAVDTDTVEIIVRGVELSVESIEFVFGKAAASQIITLQAVGGSVAYNIPRTAPWMWTVPAEGVSEGEADMIEVFADPEGLPPGTYRTELLVFGNGTNIMARIPVSMVIPEGFIPGPPPPALPEHSAVDSADFIPFGVAGHPMAPLSIISIFGEDFVEEGEFRAAAIPLPTMLGGVSVTFDGIPGSLFLVTPTLIQVQLPSGLTGPSVQMVVSNGGPKAASEPREVQINRHSPGIFTLTQNGLGQAIVTFAGTGDLAAPVGTVGNSRPATAGDFLTIYANGLGPVTPPIADGHNSCEPDGVCLPDASNVVLHRTTERVIIRIGGVEVPEENVFFSGSSPASVGVNEIVFQMPHGTQTGPAVPLTIEIGGVESLVVSMAIE